jgi:hypothetical protein
MSSPDLDRRIDLYRKDMQRKQAEVKLYSLGGDVFTTKRPECPECGFQLRADESCSFCQ